MVHKFIDDQACIYQLTLHVDGRSLPSSQFVGTIHANDVVNAVVRKSYGALFEWITNRLASVSEFTPRTAELLLLRLDTFIQGYLVGFNDGVKPGMEVSSWMGPHCHFLPVHFKSMDRINKLYKEEATQYPFAVFFMRCHTSLGSQDPRDYINMSLVLVSNL